MHGFKTPFCGEKNPMVELMVELIQYIGETYRTYNLFMINLKLHFATLKNKLHKFNL